MDSKKPRMVVPASSLEPLLFRTGDGALRSRWSQKRSYRIQSPAESKSPKSEPEKDRFFDSPDEAMDSLREG